MGDLVLAQDKTKSTSKGVKSNQIQPATQYSGVVHQTIDDLDEDDVNLDEDDENERAFKRTATLEREHAIKRSETRRHGKSAVDDQMENDLSGDGTLIRSLTQKANTDFL